MGSPFRTSPFSDLVLRTSPWKSDAVPPVPPVDPPTGFDVYNGVMTVGLGNTDQYGYSSPAGSSIGALVPATVQGTSIFDLTSLNATGSMNLNLNPAQEINNFPNGGSLDIKFGTNAIVNFVYSGGTYTAFDPALVTYLISEVGNQIQIGMNYVAGEGEG